MRNLTWFLGRGIEQLIVPLGFVCMFALMSGHDHGIVTALMAGTLIDRGLHRRCPIDQLIYVLKRPAEPAVGTPPQCYGLGSLLCGSALVLSKLAIRQLAGV